jgi:hypothetical protein
MQASSLSEVLDVDASMAMFSPTFDLPCDKEAKLMQLDPRAPDFAAQVKALHGGEVIAAAQIKAYADAIEEARASNMPTGRKVLHADDFLPQKDWHVLSCVGYMSDDPYTGAPGIEKVGEGVYKVTTLLATRSASARVTFTFRFMDPLDQARHVFSPLLVRFLSGVDHRTRPVKISDSGRIRNELQTWCSEALEYFNEDGIRLRLDKVDDAVISPEKKRFIREVLSWYRANHPLWFRWLEIA